VAAPDDTDHDPTGATYAQAVARRDQALTNAAITQLYRKNPNPAAFATWDPESFYGLAKCKLTKMAEWLGLPNVPARGESKSTRMVRPFSFSVATSPNASA